MSKEKILAELPRMKSELNYALQVMRPVTAMIEAEVATLAPEIRAKFESVGRGLRGFRAAHVGDNQTPIVYLDPEGDAPFGATPEEKEVVAWLDKTVKEKTGVGARIELGRGAAAAGGKG
jgi:hypothetical protein